jgi:hypothetical protein
VTESVRYRLLLTEPRIQEYEYDYRNRLTQVQDYLIDSDELDLQGELVNVVAYLYDVLGNRTAKIQDDLVDNANDHKGSVHP